MNSLDDRISQALRAQADQLTERDLTPMQPPRGGGRLPSGWSVPLLVAAAVVLLTVGGTLAVRAATAPDHRTPVPVASRPAPTTDGPAPTASGSVPSQQPGRSSTGQPSTPAGSPTPTASIGLPSGYQPLWPLDENGHGQSAGDPPSTALAFTRQYLGFTEITTVTSVRYDGQGAHIGVGYLNPNGQQSTSAVLHLMRFGTASGSTWEVVGSDDTDPTIKSPLTLEQPNYGATVTSPMTVGGRITGVDENIVVTVRSQARGVIGAAPGVPAGGVNTAWHRSVSFTGSGVLTIVAYTGGHLLQVERFAIQGVHT
ncbi:MAG: hypothetical protein ACJ74U_11895 [Jatrophihabitantaceae bacterium]